MAALCLRTTLTEEQREYLEAVMYSGENLLTLINDIIDVSRIEAGELTVLRIHFSLRKTLIDSMRAVSFRADGTKEIAVTCIVDEAIPDDLEGDPHRLRQIILNLVGNALKFTEKGSITVKAEKDPEDPDSMLRFSVNDTGIGITEEAQPKLFSAFTQVRKKHGNLSDAVHRRMNRQHGNTAEPDSGSRSASSWSN